MKKQSWDRYFLNICEAVASNSKCYSRKLGAVIAKDRAIISCGYNGAARGIPDCHERLTKDERLINEFKLKDIRSLPKYTCPRKILGYNSGEGLEWCVAKHAEENALLQAAMSGVSTKGAVLYLNWITPCLSCIQSCINAGIKEIVVTELKNYNEHSKFILDHTSINIREFQL